MNSLQNPIYGCAHEFYFPERLIRSKCLSCLTEWSLTYNNTPNETFQKSQHIVAKTTSYQNIYA
jgi:hypothetical protein